MRSYAEYCPIAMGSEVIGERWTPLVLRELICGSERFSDIHRGVPRMSRSLLSKRLDQLQRLGIVEHTDAGRYRLTESGQRLSGVVWALGDWAMSDLLSDPEREHFDGTHLMWRVRQEVVVDEIPEGRTVVQFDLRGAHRGARTWLLLEPEGATVCERDEGFEVDLWVDAHIADFLRLWMGRLSWDDATARGLLSLHGPTPLVRSFPAWFSRSPFAGRG